MRKAIQVINKLTPGILIIMIIFLGGCSHDFISTVRGLKSVVEGEGDIGSVANISGDIGAGVISAALNGQEACARFAVTYAGEDGKLIVMLDAFGSVSQDEDTREAFRECAAALAAMSPPVIIMDSYK